MVLDKIVRLCVLFVVGTLLFSVAPTGLFAGSKKINIQGVFYQNDGVTPIVGQGHVVELRLGL